MKRYERMAGLFLAAAGIAAALHSFLNLKLGKLSHPDSGFMPFLAGCLLAIFSTIWVITSFGKDESPTLFWGKGDWLRPLLALLLMIGYGVTMEPLGYLLSTLAFMLAWQFLVEKAKPVPATAISVIATAAMYLLFVRLLGVPVPEGMLAL